MRSGRGARRRALYSLFIRLLYFYRIRIEGVNRNWEGRTAGDLRNEAVRAYLARVEVRHRKSSLRRWKPEPFPPEGNEHLSSEINALVSGKV